MATEPQHTDREAQIAAQQRRVAELELENVQYRGLIDAVPGMVYQFFLRPDGSMGFSFVSDGSREVYGHAPEEMVADFKSAFTQVHHEDVASFMRSVSESAATLNAYKWEGRLLRDGQIRWIQAASRPQCQADGVILWDGVILDITQRKEADAALARSFRQEETIRLQEELLAQLSTPLIPLTAQIMVMPLIGHVEGTRGDRLLEALLESVVRSRASIILIDITGVPTVDAYVAGLLVKIARVLQLVGVEVILTGFSPAVAATLVGLDVDMTGIRTLGSLQSAIAAVMGPSRPRPPSRFTSRTG